MHNSSSPCQDFTTTLGTWVTSTRIRPRFAFATDSEIRFGEERDSWRNLDAHQRRSGQTFVGVLIGSLLRMPYPWKALDNLLVESSGVEWMLFVATANMEMPDACLEEICALRHLQAISFVDLSSEAAAAEKEFVDRITNGSSIESGNSWRQFFKLARAYELMQRFEISNGLRFDVVLKTRTDVILSPPVALSDFQELHSNVVYAVSDAVFLCNRDVASQLLDDILGRMVSFAGTDLDLLPLSVEQLIGSDLEDVDFFLLNYPCISVAHAGLRHILKHCLLPEVRRVGKRIPKRIIQTFKLALRTYAMHRCSSHFCKIRFEQGPPGTWCTGARWHWHNGSGSLSPGLAEFMLHSERARGVVEASKLWFYLLHRASPRVLTRRWPGGGDNAIGSVYLHPDRHYAYCGGAEPP
eukprot:TRINITY_DN57708_c0_g1_i1.p1 TRINITY_DN57708_c0_g1~~TRINITY_DN57708_c0_g1_i1.p1  ORF type:complete len:411 (+),score=45.09 TRINITY_DN57708_c0_g1_i1:252-1484(+)